MFDRIVADERMSILLGIKGVCYAEEILIAFDRACNISRYRFIKNETRMHTRKTCVSLFERVIFIQESTSRDNPQTPREHGEYIVYLHHVLRKLAVDDKFIEKC